MELVQRKVEILNRLVEISTVLNSTLELNLLLEYLMNSAAEIMEAEAASVMLWDSDQHELYIAATTTNTAELDLIGQSVPLEGSIAGTIMRTQAPLQVDNTNSDPRHYRKFDKTKGFQTRSILGVPLTAKRRPIGVLEVLNKYELPWTEDDVNYLSILADQAAVAIESAQQMAELRKAHEDLNELDKLKSDFIAIISHELRTPLGVILGYASFLQGTSDLTVNEHATKVVNSALQLRGIIEDLTNLRYLKEGVAEILRERVHLDSIIQDALSDIATLAEAQGHKLEVLPPGEPLYVYVDSIRVVMALTNVLNNAIRFTSPGGNIMLRTEVHADEAWIVIADDGIGWSEDVRDRLFDEFYQVEDHMTRKHGGLGIGLSIAQALAAANKGRIWGSSPGPGKGATFTLALPLAKDAETR